MVLKHSKVPFGTWKETVYTKVSMNTSLTIITLYTKPIPVNQRTMICRGHQTSSLKWKQTKVSLSYEVLNAWKEPRLTESVEVYIVQYFGDKRKRDIDAYIKILLDSMSGIVYDDDSQIMKMTVLKLYDKDNPRTEIICQKYDKRGTENIEEYP